MVNQDPLTPRVYEDRSVLDDMPEGKDSKIRDILDKI